MGLNNFTIRSSLLRRSVAVLALGLTLVSASARAAEDCHPDSPPITVPPGTAANLRAQLIQLEQLRQKTISDCMARNAAQTTQTNADNAATAANIMATGNDASCDQVCDQAQKNPGDLMFSQVADQCTAYNGAEQGRVFDYVVLGLQTAALGTCLLGCIDVLHKAVLNPICKYMGWGATGLEIISAIKQSGASGAMGAVGKAMAVMTQGSIAKAVGAKAIERAGKAAFNGTYEAMTKAPVTAGAKVLRDGATRPVLDEATKKAATDAAEEKAAEESAKKAKQVESCVATAFLGLEVGMRVMSMKSQTSAKNKACQNVKQLVGPGKLRAPANVNGACTNGGTCRDGTVVVGQGASCKLSCDDGSTPTPGPGGSSTSSGGGGRSSSTSSGGPNKGCTNVGTCKNGDVVLGQAPSCKLGACSDGSTPTPGTDPCTNTGSCDDGTEVVGQPPSCKLPTCADGTQPTPDGPDGGDTSSSGGPGSNSSSGGNNTSSGTIQGPPSSVSSPGGAATFQNPLTSMGTLANAQAILKCTSLSTTVDCAAQNLMKLSRPTLSAAYGQNNPISSFPGADRQLANDAKALLPGLFKRLDAGGTAGDAIGAVSSGAGAGISGALANVANAGAAAALAADPQTVATALYGSGGGPNAPKGAGGEDNPLAGLGAEGGEAGTNGEQNFGGERDPSSADGGGSDMPNGDIFHSHQRGESIFKIVSERYGRVRERVDKMGWSVPFNKSVHQQ